MIDHNDRLLDRARKEFSDVRVEPNARSRGASGARNTAGALARGDIVAFLDDDARATDTWLEELIEPFEDPQIAGVGGKALPLWPERRPLGVPRSLTGSSDVPIADFRSPRPSYATSSERTCPFGASVMVAVGGFREGYGNISGGGPAIIRRRACPPGKRRSSASGSRSNDRR